MKTIITTFLLLLSLNSQSQWFNLDGPDAPDVSIGVNGSSFEFYLTNTPSSNNYQEWYQEFNANIYGSRPDSNFTFQGYLVYQVNNNLIDQALQTYLKWEDIFLNPSIARLVAQSDVADNITTIVNHIYDSTNSVCNSYSVLPVAQNTGAQSFYSVNTDAFTGQPYVLNSTYCFMTVAYAVDLYNYDTACYPLTRPLIYSKKSTTGAILKHCVSLSGTGIDETELSYIHVSYSNNQLIIRSSNNQNIGNFNLYKADGKLIHSENYQNSEVYLPVSEYATGIYIHEVKNERGKSIGKIYISKD